MNLGQDISMENQEFEVTPTRLIYGGDALARLPDGRAVFVPFALPDESCRIRLVEEKQRFARAELIKIKDPAPSRIEPRCKHFTECGGCHYQHIPYPAQLQIKREILIDQFTRVGKIADPPVSETVASPQPFGYRNHIQFQISETGQLGFHRHRSQQVVPIQECHLPDELINEIWPILELEAVPGLNRISIRSGEGGEDGLIVFEVSEVEPLGFEFDLPVSAVLQGPGGELVLSGDEFTIIPIHDYPFVVSAGAFFQTNTMVTELMVDHLLDNLPLTEDSTVVDVYCGVGLFSHFLAPRVKELIAIESHPGAGEDFLYNLSGFDQVQFYSAPAEEVLPNLDLSPDLILVDPPRAGLSRVVTDSLSALKPNWIAYISCDPATLARDASRLIAHGYNLIDCTPFDMFPQTYHIESVSIFQRASKQA